MKTNPVRIVLAVAFAFLLSAVGSALATATVTTNATGGSAISADTAGGAYTSLTGPVLSESTHDDIGTGTIILNVPAGFVFNPSATVTATVTKLAGNKTALTLSSSTATVTSTNITITVATQDDSNGNNTYAEIAWSGIQVRPSAGTPLASGNITKSGTATITGITGSSNFGTLTEAGGAVVSNLVFTTAPGGATAGSAFGTQPVVQTKDQFGNNSPAGLGASVTVTLAIKTGTGTLQGTTNYDIGTAHGNGTITGSGLRIDQAASFTLSATASGFTESDSGSFTVSPAAANKLVILTQPSTNATAGAAFAQQPVIAIQDAFGNLIVTNNSTIVSAARATGNGVLQGTTNHTAAGGIVTFTDLSHNVANTITLLFTSSGLASTNSGSIVVNPAAATQLAFTTQPGSATINAPFGTQPVVSTEDQFGNLSTVGLTTNLIVSLDITNGVGSLLGATSFDIGTLAGNGVVTFTNLEIDTATNYQLAASAPNFTSGVSVSFAVAKGAQTIAFHPISDQTYDVAPVGVSATATSGLQVSFSILSGPATIVGTNVTLTGAGVVNVVVTQAGDDNYLPADPVTNSFTVNPKTITGQAAVAGKVYDGNTSATVTNLSLTGVINLDDVSLTGGSAHFSDKNAAAGKTVTVTNLTLTGAAAASYVLASSTVTTTADITALGLTVTAAGVNKVYDGTNTASVTLTNNGLAGDNLINSYAAATFDNKNVGTGKPVSVTGINVTGTDATNYTFNTTANTTASITALGLTVTAAGVNKAYDGTITASVTLTNNGLAGDNLVNSYAAATFADAAVGTNKPVSVTGINVTGTDATNYTFNITANTTANITLAVLTAHIRVDNKVYDGNTDATITNRTLSGVIDSEDVSLEDGTATFDNKNVGTNKLVTATGLSLAGDDAGNYTLLSDTATNSAVIAPATLTLTADDKTRAYGAPNPGFTLGYSGFVNGEGLEILSGLPSVFTTATGTSSVAGSTYPIIVTNGTLVATNYTLAFVNGALTITKATLKVAADNQSRVYGTANPPLTATITGFANSEGVGVLGGSPALNTVAISSSPAGTYPITAALGTLTAANYGFTFTNGVLTVTSASTITTVASSLNPSLPGSNVTFTATVSAVPSASGFPIGTVQFVVDNIPLGAPAAISGGIATINTAALSFGHHTVVVQYAGNGNFSGSTNSLNPDQLVNRPPVASNDTLTAYENLPAAVAASVLKANDADPDGDSFDVTAVSATSVQGGTVSLASGTVTYTPPASYTGTDSFTYTIADTFGATASGTVNVTVLSQPNLITQIEQLGDRNVRLHVQGVPNHNYVVQATTNIVPPLWLPISTNATDVNGLFIYNDLQATNHIHRFYRTVLP